MRASAADKSTAPPADGSGIPPGVIGGAGVGIWTGANKPVAGDHLLKDPVMRSSPQVIDTLVAAPHGLNRNLAAQAVPEMIVAWRPFSGRLDGTARPARCGRRTRAATHEQRVDRVGARVCAGSGTRRCVVHRVHASIGNFGVARVGEPGRADWAAVLVERGGQRWDVIADEDKAPLPLAPLSGATSN